MELNDLESAIRSAVLSAQKNYIRMSGWWLHHGPESFLQHQIAWAVMRRCKTNVFTEVSPKKIGAERIRGPGRTYKARKRFDIIVWPKSSNIPRAVIEVKRAWRLAPVRADANKIRSYIKHRNAAKNGYIIIYSDVSSFRGRSRSSERRNHLCRIFNRWGCALSRTGWKCINMTVVSPQGDGAEDVNGNRYSWGFALYRVSASRVVSHKSVR